MDMPAICVTVEVRPLHAVLQAAGLDVGRMRKIRVSFHGMACRIAIRHVRDQLCTSHKAPCTTPSTSPPPCHGSPRTSLSICAQCLCPIAHVPPTVRVIVPDAQAG